MNYHEPLYKDNLYHIYNRGNGKEKIFFTDKNYFYFLHKYDKYLSDVIETFAYCLLPNHFHLLARITNDTPELISDKFRKFFISYSMSINKQEKRHGNLFERGFKRKLIGKDKYLYAAVYYIHSNPVHHRIVEDLKQYKYSSYHSLISKKKTKLRRDEVLEWFGGKENFIEYHSEQKDNFNENFLIED